jgi:MYXO-CTERM domain-containing protein
LGRALLICALVAVPATALAHPGPPVSHDVFFAPGNPDRMSFEVSWGLLQTEDGGATWHWMCEDAIGFGGAYYPDHAYAQDGRLFATTTSALGLTATADHCTWGGGLVPGFVSQIEVLGDGTVLAAASNLTDMRIYGSDDDGVTFTPRATPDAMVTVWESMVAGPTRVWLSGYWIDPAKHRVLYRSDDGGTVWTPVPLDDLALPDCDLLDLQVAAVSPTDPDIVFVRVHRANCTGIGDDIWRSIDGGASWTKVFASGDDVTSVVVRANGQVLLGEKLSGLHISDDGGATFGDDVPGVPEVDCLRERADGLLFLCSVSFPPENMAIGTSSDAMTWTSIFTYDQTTDAYPDCAAGTVQHDICLELNWCTRVCQLQIDDPSCVCTAPPPDAGPPPPPPPPDDPGCCSSGTSSGAWLSAVVVGVLLFRRRRRR